MSALAALARPSGAFAMVAIDQRESLRTILAEEGRTEALDAALVDFKVEVARDLSPHASAMLVDARLGLDSILAAEALDPSCALIVAADELVQEPGGPVSETRIDPDVDADLLRARGAAALKLLVIWRDDALRDRRRRMTAEFVERCRAAGLASVVEGVVRPSSSAQLNAAIEEAARELAGCAPDLYKAEVPHHGAATRDEITAAAGRITAAIDCPWVVLSQGVALETFPAAVEASCRGGASGFLAGRAIWRDAVGRDADGLGRRLAERSVPRLRRLAELVDEVARPRPAA